MDSWKLLNIHGVTKKKNKMHINTNQTPEKQFHEMQMTQVTLPGREMRTRNYSPEATGTSVFLLPLLQGCRAEKKLCGMKDCELFDIDIF